jgi:hypothetical protein
MPKKSKQTARDKDREARERAKSAADRAKKKAGREDFSQAAARIVTEATSKADQN